MKFKAVCEVMYEVDSKYYNNFTPEDIMRVDQEDPTMFMLSLMDNTNLERKEVQLNIKPLGE